METLSYTAWQTQYDSKRRHVIYTFVVINNYCAVTVSQTFLSDNSYYNVPAITDCLANQDGMATTPDLWTHTVTLV